MRTVTLARRSRLIGPKRKLVLGRGYPTLMAPRNVKSPGSFIVTFMISGRSTSWTLGSFTTRRGTVTSHLRGSSHAVGSPAQAAGTSTFSAPRVERATAAFPQGWRCTDSPGGGNGATGIGSRLGPSWRRRMAGFVTSP
jgi:hypothetical protein